MMKKSRDKKKIVIAKEIITKEKLCKKCNKLFDVFGSDDEQECISCYHGQPLQNYRNKRYK